MPDSQLEVRLVKLGYRNPLIYFRRELLPITGDLHSAIVLSLLIYLQKSSQVSATALEQWFHNVLTPKQLTLALKKLRSLNLIVERYSGGSSPHFIVRILWANLRHQGFTPRDQNHPKQLQNLACGASVPPLAAKEEEESK